MKLADADTARLRARLVATLRRAGVLDDQWRAAFNQVPRHVFLDRFFRPLPGERWAAVAPTDTRWMDYVYSDRVLVTQLDTDPGRWDVARREGSVVGTPTSSSSQPAIMAIMLTELLVSDTHRVLEIGTGTGYNAALLCHRLGDHRVTTVDIDPGLVAVARDRLADIGYQPTCAGGDGALGYPDNAPYDRVLATCAVSEIPLPWLAQTTPGGVVLTTLSRPLGAGMVRITVGDDATGVGWVLAEDGRFMALRHAETEVPQRLSSPNEPVGDTRSTDLRISDLTSPASPLEFFAGLELPDVSSVSDDAGGAWLVHPDGSWARWHRRYGRYAVSQGGPRRLWDIAEQADERWQALGRPRRDRFGISVSPDGQWLWLDQPDSENRWPLVGSQN